MQFFKHQLAKLVEKYRQWLSDNYTSEQITQLLVDNPGYPNWWEIEAFFKELFENLNVQSLDEDDLKNIFYLIAKSEENGRILAWFSRGEQLSALTHLEQKEFVKLAKALIKIHDVELAEAKHQFAASFSKFDKLTQEIEEILLSFYADQDEYTKRQALMSLAKLGYPDIKKLLTISWTMVNEEHHKMACLYIIDKYLKDEQLMKQYLLTADKESGTDLAKYVDTLKQNPNYR